MALDAAVPKLYQNHERTGRSESVVRVFLKSAQAASAGHQRARNPPIPPGRSKSVVRFLRSVAPA